MKSIIINLILTVFSYNLIAQNNIIVEENFNDNQLDQAIVFSPDLEGFCSKIKW